MHRLVQFHAINRPPVFVSGSAVNCPETGNLSDLLRVLCAILAEHTSTPESCCFCLWEGHGWLQDSGAVLRAALRSAPRVHLPNRDYLLFEGPLEAASEFGWNMPGGGFVPQTPNLFWPEDHAWCIASEIDLYCTLVAGSNALSESLIADHRLEGWRVFADDSVSWDSDDKNT